MLRYLGKTSRGKSITLVALTLLGACAGRPEPLAKAPTYAQTEGVRYVCANKKSFLVSFSPKANKAVIKLDDNDLYEVQQQVSGSGVRYGSDVIEFSGKGRLGQLTKSPDGAYPDCKVVD